MTYLQYLPELPQGENDRGIVLINSETSELYILGLGWLGAFISRIDSDELETPFNKIKNLREKIIFSDDKRFDRMKFEILGEL